MSAPNDNELPAGEKVRLGALGPQIVRVGGAVGVIFLAATVVLGLMSGDHMRRFFHSYLVGFTYFVSLGLGALFFVLLHHITRTKWGVTSRRIAECVTGAFPLLFVLSFVLLLPMLLGHEGFYSWSNHEYLHEHHLVENKTAWLNVPFFAVRCVLYFLVWMALARYFFKKSVAQDKTGDPAASDQMRRAAGPALFAFALTLNFFAWDVLMSLEPEWYSTMYGVYFFGGCGIAFYAALALFSMVLRRRGIAAKSITVEHYHDMGKMLFAFVFFWAYIAFSQFMLLWYGNIPEETTYYNVRIMTEWKWVSLALLFLHWMIPFVFLLSRHTKRRLPLLALFSVWMLVMHWVDIYWLVMPAYSPGAISLSLMDITATLGIGGLVVATIAKLASSVDIIPTKDPRLGESLRFENI